MDHRNRTMPSAGDRSTRDRVDQRYSYSDNEDSKYSGGGGYDHPDHPTSLRGDGYGSGGRGRGGSSSGGMRRRENQNNNSSQDGTGMGLRRRRSGRSPPKDPNDPNDPSSIQSHNYEPDESEVWRAYVAQVHFANRGHWWTMGKKRALKRWILTFLIGVIQALVATLCNLSSNALSKKKYDHVNDLLSKEQNVNTHLYGMDSSSSLYDTTVDYTEEVAEGDDLFVAEDGISKDNALSDSTNDDSSYDSFFGSAFLAFLFYQTVFAAIASLFVWIEPVAAGSGIPEIKCFLNGIDLPRVVRVKTLLCKVIGVTFSVAAGLPVGKEGPMVHSGAVVAAGISQGKTKICKGAIDTSFSKFADFRNDREKRDFVACGAAAGVCAAFGAPIGGVLFTLEEGASYWSTKLTWRAFFCAMTTLATLFAIRNVDSFWSQANMSKLFSFGEFRSLTAEDSNYSIWELLLFIIIGCLGGLIGAVFNAANEHLTIWRMKRVNHSKIRRFLEVIVVSIITTVISFYLPVIWARCTELPKDMQDWSNQEKDLVEALVPFRCVPGKEYNEVASLIFVDADTAIKQLFHFRESGGVDDSTTFSSGALFLFFIPYLSLASLVYGIAVPSGLFVPSLLAGAAFGRLCGHLLHKLDHTNGTFADSGTYALMGAAAVLGGMARMTISLTVILLEATGDMQYVLPLMLTLMAARFTGNVFNEGLYDIHIHLKHIPFLEPEVPTIAERNEIVAGQAMSTEVKCLRPVERAGVVYDLLQTCQHGNFPIVDTEGGGTLYGTASRSMLCTLLKRRAFDDAAQCYIEKKKTKNKKKKSNIEDHSVTSVGSANSGGSGNGNNGQHHDEEDVPPGPRKLSPLVQWDTIERAYPKYPTIDDVDMRDGDRNCWLDLRPYANTAPYTINETASIQRTYRLFRTLGLRFLCVVNHHNQVVGIITRKDLLPESLTSSLLRGRHAHIDHDLHDDGDYDDDDDHHHNNVTEGVLLSSPPTHHHHQHYSEEQKVPIHSLNSQFT